MSSNDIWCHLVRLPEWNSYLFIFGQSSFSSKGEIPPRSGPGMIILLLHTQHSSTTAVQTHKKVRSPVSKWPSPILPWEEGGEGMFTYFHPAYINKSQKAGGTQCFVRNIDVILIWCPHPIDLQFLCKTSPNIYDINRLLETILFSSVFLYIVTGTSPILWQFLSLLVLYKFVPTRPSYVLYFTKSC